MTGMFFLSTCHRLSFQLICIVETDVQLPLTNRQFSFTGSSTPLPYGCCPSDRCSNWQSKHRVFKDCHHRSLRYRTIASIALFSGANVSLRSLFQETYVFLVSTCYRFGSVDYIGELTSVFKILLPLSIRESILLSCTYHGCLQIVIINAQVRSLLRCIQIIAASRISCSNSLVNRAIKGYKTTCIQRANSSNLKRAILGTFWCSVHEQKRLVCCAMRR